MGRHAESQALDRLVEAVHAGRSQSLVLRGEAGVGKSALLKYLLDRAADCRVVSATGVQAEMELPFAALHQLLAPMPDLLDSLPGPQRDALRIVFGILDGPAPDRFLLGLAVLGLLSAAAESRPLVCAPDAALSLLAAALAGPLDELQRARASLLRAEIAFTTHRGNLAPPMLLEVARQLEPLDVSLARETYLQALSAAMFAGRLAVEGGGLLEIAAAARAAPVTPVAPRAADLLLDALAVLLTDDAPTAAPAMRRALRAFTEDDISPAEELRWLWLAFIIAVALWDDRSCRVLADRHVRLARDAGALAALPLGLSSRIIVHLFRSRPASWCRGSSVGRSSTRLQVIFAEPAVHEVSCWGELSDRSCGATAADLRIPAT
ncbi:ATP-binding protein [Streptomyces dysideae]|uniref:Orc1-like AAA ATPase domain-containing protein n=1 Tax=Streptomyces dysideae TaxID=909626 RepID=A0A117S0E5_9ACTN|nr:ATP-binding protein [Streptomyces dysideae]KUO18829.1 hypothetical protein AQJ91_23500 [Streptomyces dysideae]